MKRAKKIYSIALCGLTISALAGCKVSGDAIAASQQMTYTASGLNDYYTTLEAEVADTVSLYELDGSISGLPYDDDDRKLQQLTRGELEKRREMAATLASLASSMAALTSSRASSDLETSATRLANELIDVKALPGGSPLPAAAGKAADALLQIIQQREEKKAARAMDETLQAVEDIFSREKPVYDSLARTHAREASQVTQDLIDRDAVDPTPMLAPALKPYGLGTLPATTSLQGTLKKLASSRLKGATAEAIKKEGDASAGMLEALHEMSSRVHLVATEKPMPLRGTPFSLKFVESWVQSWSASLI